MTASQPTPRLTDRKRDAIVQAAIGEFREHGFNGTSMDRVAAAADVSKRTVYNHFPSKEELFEAILLLMWERSQSPDELAYTPARPLRDQLLEPTSEGLYQLTAHALPRVQNLPPRQGRGNGTAQAQQAGHSQTGAPADRGWQAPLRVCLGLPPRLRPG